MVATQKITVGSLVTHPNRPEWGPGKIIAVKGPHVDVCFREREFVPGTSPVITLSTTAVPLSLAPYQSDGLLDNLPKDIGGRPGPSRGYVTLDQAKRAFRELFPLGFGDPKYLGDQGGGERSYKWEAHESWEATLGHGEGERLLASGDIGELTKRAEAVVERVNLLAVFEVAALRDGLKDTKAARRFFRALFELLAAPAPERARFEALVGATQGLPAAKGKTNPDKWTLVTLLPFLARPDTFMFLKPEATKRAADMIRFDLRYDAHPNWPTYRRLLAFAGMLMDELKEFGPRDLIDVQSFMWVVAGGGYALPISHRKRRQDLGS